MFSFTFSRASPGARRHARSWPAFIRPIGRRAVLGGGRTSPRGAGTQCSFPGEKPIHSLKSHITQGLRSSENSPSLYLSSRRSAIGHGSIQRVRAPFSGWQGGTDNSIAARRGVWRRVARPSSRSQATKKWLASPSVSPSASAPPPASAGRRSVNARMWGATRRLTSKKIARRWASAASSSSRDPECV